MIFFEVLDPGETINIEKYCEQLKILKDKIHLERPSLRKNQVVFLQDNARPHTAKKIKELLASFKWDMLKHPSCSPDLTPSDYHLFRSMIHALSEKKFDTKEDVYFFFDNFFKEKNPAFFKRGIKLLTEKWQKTIDNEGKYFD